MKSVVFYIIFSLLVLVFPSEVESGNDAKVYRNIWMRKIDVNGTGITVGSRIHGGADAYEGQFKYMVFLLCYSSKNHRLPDATCSASLVHPSWVLTAAHCVSSAMIAVAGKADLSQYWLKGRSHISYGDYIDEHRFGVQERKVQRMVVHHKYSTITNDRDLALLYLEEPFDMASNYAPVALLPLAAGTISEKMNCIAVGWGLKDHEIQTFRLMFAQPVYAKTPELGCKYGHIDYIRKGSFICLEAGGPGICSGDSGSPLVCKDVAWGVASFSLSSSSKSDCSSKNEEYYSRIYTELEWIRATMKGAAIPLLPFPNLIFLIPIFTYFLISNSIS